MPDELQLRIRVLEAWDDIIISVPAGTPVGAVKRQALIAARVASDPDGFEVKFRGALIRDESRSLADEHVPTDGALIVLRCRRVPVR